MKKILMISISFIITALFAVGCSSKGDVQKFNMYEIALKEAKKIASEQGYTLKSENLTESDILIGDSDVFELIKNASIEGGYSEENFKSVTKNIKVVEYELEEKSKFKDMPVTLCLVVDEGKVIGAYLDYSGYMPSIAPVDFKGNFKQL
ncbi:hypothetical protein [Terrisporobacter vanillatitrophus]|uniref:hypothetical protein n=1 Tax=Terrisporobacter vanillatitrophus TaxID=3058402 RepID=UPI003367DCCB